MTSTPSSARRLLAVSVEIPPSPFRSRSSFSSLPLTTSKLKENASGASKRKADDPPTQLAVKKARKLSDDETGPVVYCHQCNKKRDPADCVQCTFQRTRNTKNAQPCKVTFCRNCLYNRYNDDLDNIKETSASPEEEGYCGTQGYTFKCFKCRDICNCRNCRKTKGLAPLGNLHLAERRKNVEVLQASKSVAPPVPQIEATQNVAKVAKPKVPKPKIVPRLRWDPLDTSLGPSDAEDRIFIREFVARFSPDSGFAKTHVDELSLVGGSKRTADGELAGWISEPCLKAILTWLLEVLVDDNDDPIILKLLKDAQSGIRNSGCNLNKMWTALSVLQDRACPFAIPDALPHSESAVIRTTRSTRDEGPSRSATYVAQSSQLVPAVVGLVTAVLGTEVVRTELDDGLQRHKEFVREKQERVKQENEKWDVIKAVENAAQDPDFKAKRAHHKQVLDDLDHALKIASFDSALRSGPLGVDSDGRKYWAVSPGAGDRQYAQASLACAGKKPSRRRGAKHGKKGDSDFSPDWSSVVVVWGCRPADALLDDDDDEGEDGESWWVFPDAKAVNDLALWLESKVDEDGKDVALRKLVADLKDRASILKWKDSPSEDAA